MSKRKLTEAIRHLSHWSISSKEDIEEFDKEIGYCRLEFKPEYRRQFNKIAREMRIIALKLGKINKTFLSIHDECDAKMKKLLKSVKSV